MRRTVIFRSRGPTCVAPGHRWLFHAVGQPAAVPILDTALDTEEIFCMIIVLMVYRKSRKSQKS